MKEVVEKRKFETINVDEANASAFSVEMNPMAYKILSSGLYSDKIAAVIREYSCNARDSHLMADKGSTPIKVHLPNTFEPYFSVQDEGIGLSHGEIITIFTSYFTSTKRTENISTGCKGLGSKSGFAYTDQFTVTSVHSGVSRHYSCYKAEDGVPTVNLISEGAAKGVPNGVTVVIPVKSNDIQQFIDKAKNIYKYFDVLPEFSGAADFQVEKPEYSFKGTLGKDGTSASSLSYGILENSKSYRNRNSQQSKAVQGAVAYPFNLSRFSHVQNIPETVRMFLQETDVDIYFPVGAISITASREEIEYDERTERNIIKAVLAMVEHHKKDVEKQFKDAKTLYEAKSLYAKIYDETSYKSLTRAILKDGIKWKDKDITNVTIHIDVGYEKEITLDDPAAPNGKRKTKVKTSDYHIRTYNMYYKNPKEDYSSHQGVFSVSCPQDTHRVVFNDINKRNNFKKVLQHNYDCRQGDYRDSLSITLINIENFEDKTEEEREKLWKELKKAFGGFPIDRMSNLEEPPKETRALKNGALRVLRDSYWSGTVEYTKEKKVESGGVYIVMHASNPEGYEGSLMQVKEAWDFAKNHGLIHKDTPIFALNKTTIKDIGGMEVLTGKDSKWIEFSDFLGKSYERNYKKAFKGKMKGIRMISERNYLRSVLSKSAWLSFSDLSKFPKVVSRVSLLEKAQNHWEKLRKRKNFLDREIEKNKVDRKFEHEMGEFEAFIKKYCNTSSLTTDKEDTKESKFARKEPLDNPLCKLPKVLDKKYPLLYKLMTKSYEKDFSEEDIIHYLDLVEGVSLDSVSSSAPILV